MKVLEEALSSMNTSQECTILKLIIFQIFAVYYQSKSDSVSSSKFYLKALKECRDASHTSLLVITMPQPAIKKVGKHCIISTNTACPSENQPLQVETVLLVFKAIQNFTTSETSRIFGNMLLTMLNDCELAINTTTTGWFNFHHNVVGALNSLGRYREALALTEERIGFHHKALQAGVRGEENNGESQEQHEEALAKNYCDQGDIQYGRSDYTEALLSFTRALNIRIKLFGEEHRQTAESYYLVGVTQHSLENYTAALESKKRALHIRMKLFGEEHSETADSYHSVGVTQHSLSDYAAAFESKKHTLDIRIKLFGEEHSDTADSYHSVGVTQHSLTDYTFALESKKRALDIRIKLFGEEYPKTADSYHSVGATQHSLMDYTAALDSKKRALDITIKLFGEEHCKTADSYNEVGVTQHSLNDYTAALESKKRAFDIIIKLFGEEHNQSSLTDFI